MFSFVARLRPPPTPIPKSYSVKSSTYLHTTPLPELPRQPVLLRSQPRQKAKWHANHPAIQARHEVLTSELVFVLPVLAFTSLFFLQPPKKRKFHICSCHFDDECEGGAKKYLGKYTNVQENARGQIFVTYPDISLSKQTNKPNKDITLYQTHMDDV